eukprot:m.51277 g.51277  ORF g.51277 m.51277 type:complete len:187 (+) comp12972_c0_seq2:235-795(+)
MASSQQQSSPQHHQQQQESVAKRNCTTTNNNNNSHTTTSTAAEDDLCTMTRRWFADVWNDPKENAIERYFHPDGIAHGLTDDKGQAIRGPPGFRILYNRFRSAFSEIKIEVCDCFQAGEKVACRFSFRGVHSGSGLGMPPTGRTVTATGMSITYWHNGFITESWNEFDTAALLQQIGQPPTAKVFE